MGLFGLFKGNASKQEKIKYPKRFNIICPYCFKEFSTNKVVFRANSHRDGETDYALKEDKLLKEYLRRTGNYDEDCLLPPVIDPEGLPIGSRVNVDEVLVEVVDPHGEATQKRLCPYCHNELPITSGKGPTKIISVVGASQVGKSVYMTTLLHTLQNHTASSFNAACIPVSSKYSEKLRQYEYILFDHGKMLEATQKERHMEPLIVVFKFKDDSRPPLTLVFYDVAGEGMTDQEYLRKHGPHIKNSNGILFLVDPEQMRTLRMKIALKNAGKPGDASLMYAEPKDIIVNLFENFINRQSNERTSIPTAVVLTKSDVLKDLKDEDYINSNSNIFFNYCHRGAFNLAEFENINGEVKRFVSKVDQSFKDAVDVYFKNNAYFAVSSLGRKPIEQSLEGIISPFRVDEPFLWLLYQFNYIEGGR